MFTTLFDNSSAHRLHSTRPSSAGLARPDPFVGTSPVQPGKREKPSPGALLDLADRLIGVSRIGDQTVVGAVGQQVQFLQDGLADEHLVTQNQGFFQGVAALPVKKDGFRDPALST